MLGGIVVQLVAITIYVILAGEFAYRVVRNRPIRIVQSQISPAGRTGIRREEKLQDKNVDSDIEIGVVAAARPRGILTKNIQLMLFALAASSLFLFIRWDTSMYTLQHALTSAPHRSIYRTIELSDGWSGRIISTQLYFSMWLSFCVSVVRSSDS